MIDFWIRTDSEDAAFRNEQLRSLGIVDRLVTDEILSRGENLSEVECDACGDGHIESLVWISEPPDAEPRAYIWCTDAGRVRVERQRLEAWRVDLNVLARTISNVLGLGTSPHSIIDSRLWLLGNSRFGDRVRDVFIARGATWPDARSLVDQARLKTSPCPVILVPNLLPNDSAWTGNGRILLSMSEFDWFGDDSDAVLPRFVAIATEHDRQTTAVEEVLFRKGGRTWTLSFNGKAVHIQDMLGLGYVADLLRKPGVPIEATALAGASVESTKITQLTGMLMADETTIKAVRRNLAEKKSELSGLQKRDWTRKGALEEEIAKLQKYLGEVETHKGHARKVAGTAQRSRTSVTNAIRRAIDQIATQHPALGSHLKESIKTGTTPIYAPAVIPDWRFQSQSSSCHAPCNSLSRRT